VARHALFVFDRDNWCHVFADIDDAAGQLEANDVPMSVRSWLAHLMCRPSRRRSRSSATSRSSAGRRRCRPEHVVPSSAANVNCGWVGERGAGRGVTIVGLVPSKGNNSTIVDLIGQEPINSALACGDRRRGSDVPDRIVVTTGRDAYRRSDGIAVIPGALLGA
jgi:hypothetical protein